MVPGPSRSPLPSSPLLTLLGYNARIFPAYDDINAENWTPRSETVVHRPPGLEHVQTSFCRFLALNDCVLLQISAVWTLTQFENTFSVNSRSVEGVTVDYGANVSTILSLPLAAFLGQSRPHDCVRLPNIVYIEAERFDRMENLD